MISKPPAMAAFVLSGGGKSRAARTSIVEQAIIDHPDHMARIIGEIPLPRLSGELMQISEP